MLPSGTRGRASSDESGAARKREYAARGASCGSGAFARRDIAGQRVGFGTLYAKDEAGYSKSFAHGMAHVYAVGMCVVVRLVDGGG